MLKHKLSAEREREREREEGMEPEIRDAARGKMERKKEINRDNENTGEKTKNAGKVAKS